ncbi:MAG: hypothetical protein Q9187_001092 [Circinaria calcarea]
MAAIRSSVRVARGFRTTNTLQQVRRLHITGSIATPSSRLVNTDQPVRPTAEATVPTSSAQPQATRHFNTSRSLKAVKDSSTIDFAYMPQYTLEEPSPSHIFRIPLLPDNYNPPRQGGALQEAVEEVIRPEISTTSADDTHRVSAMSEVTDNDAVELDPYDLTKQVSMAAKRVMGNVKEEVAGEQGIVKQLWTGLLDDLLGVKKVAKA